MIEIPEQGDAQHRLWCDLLDLAEAFPGQWTVIGAHMVALHAWEAALDPRPSEDIDVLANVRLHTSAARDIAAFLLARGYEPEVTRDGIAHLFRRRDAGQIDLFVPDGLRRRTGAASTVPPHRTLQVPGGTQALDRSAAVDVRTREREGTLLRPSLLAAIIIKLRAIDVDDVPDAQRGDVALLLSLVSDPDGLAPELTRSDRRTLAEHAYFADPGPKPWNLLPDERRENAALVYRRLLG